ncbi:ROK family transcriptional regulator [Actinophytocola sp.]|uniref:ROK family transcriptional regulator n=1 Tax=Actinophytocola sp. TaxID=1872138 RepID=UPI002ED6AB53
MTRTVAVGTKFMLENNAAAILTHLRAVRRAPVSAIAKDTGLSRQAVTRSLAVLESMELAEISAPERAAGGTGRPPQMVRFRAEAGQVLSVVVNPGTVRIVVADLAGEFTTDVTAALRRSSRRSLTDSLRKAIERSGVDPAGIWHATASAPGIVDPVTGHVGLSVSMPEVTGDAILAGIQSAGITAPVYVDNDVKLATEGERWRGTPHVEDSLVFVDWGERIGAGIVLRGELYRGASNDAGDLGYLDLAAPKTGGGDDLGPFERWVGTRELLRLAGRPVALPELAAAAHRGERWATGAVGKVASRFAKGVAAIRALLDPEVVVLGGDIVVLGEVLLDAVIGALETEELRQPRLELSTLGADAIVYGAVRHSLAWVERERFDVRAIRQR